MSKKRRLIMLTLLTLVFFVAGPVLILIASGYSFGEVVSLTKINFLRTGGIYISDIGSDSKVYVDGKDVGGTSFFDRSILIQNLLPRNHSVKIERQGYRIWEKRLIVFPKRVTEIHPVLIPEKIVFERVRDNATVISVTKELQKKKEQMNLSSSTPYNLKSGEMRVRIDGSKILTSWQNLSDTPQYMCVLDSCAKELSISFDEKVFDLEWFPGTNYGLVAVTNYGIYIVEFDERGGRQMIKVLRPDDFSLNIFVNPKLATWEEETYLNMGKDFYKISISKPLI